MKYLKSLKSHFDKGREMFKRKKLIISEVIENIEYSLVDLDIYDTNISHIKMLDVNDKEKFNIRIYKQTKNLSDVNFKFYDIKEQILFMLHLTNSSYKMSGFNLYFRGLNLDYTLDVPEMTFTKIEDLEKASNIETSGITIYFFLDKNI